MISRENEKLILKYLTNNASANDLNELTRWLTETENFDLFKSYAETNFVINASMKEYDPDQTKKQLLALINTENRRKRLRVGRRRLLKYVASIIVVLSIGYLTYKRGTFNDHKDAVAARENVTLQLQSGEVIVIEEDKPSEIKDKAGNIIGVHKNGLLTYASHTKLEGLVYNTLTVPYGKRFKVDLSDGSIVKLNAGSSLRYPIHFIGDENRQVFLVGEAFFEVVKDEKRPFIVNTSAIDIKVLGTKFNVSCYPEDAHIRSVLIEGSVSVYKTGLANGSTTDLSPGEMATWIKGGQSIEKAKTDVETHIAWMNGRLVLYEVPFYAILKKLERQYDVVFINNDKDLLNRYFTAKFDVEDITQVMASLSLSGNFEYRFDKNKVIINPKN